jgi:5-methylcytosine-specific restriction enzyme B
VPPVVAEVVAVAQLVPGLGQHLVEPDLGHYAHASYVAKASKVDEIHAFLTRMQPGDVVVTTSQGRMFVGTVEGAAVYVKSSDERSNLRRPVAWADTEGVDYQDIPADVASRLQVQYEVVDMTRALDLLEPFLVGEDAPDQTTTVPRPGSWCWQMPRTSWPSSCTWTAAGCRSASTCSGTVRS